MNCEHMETQGDNRYCNHPDTKAPCVTNPKSVQREMMRQLFRAMVDISDVKQYITTKLEQKPSEETRQVLEAIMRKIKTF